MGSSGTGNFSDYSGGRGDGGAGGGGTGGGQGGGSNPKEDRCLELVENVRIQEVERSEYYVNRESVPRNGTQVVVRSTLVGGRIAVETKSGKEVIGVLPTKLNYLRRCIEQGYSYSGEVVESKAGLVPSLRVNLDAE
jgi:hypothetical protein